MLVAAAGCGRCAAGDTLVIAAGSGRCAGGDAAAGAAMGPCEGTGSGNSGRLPTVGASGVGGAGTVRVSSTCVSCSWDSNCLSVHTGFPTRVAPALKGFDAACWAMCGAPKKQSTHDIFFNHEIAKPHMAPKPMHYRTKTLRRSWDYCIREGTRNRMLWHIAARDIAQFSPQSFHPVFARLSKGLAQPHNIHSEFSSPPKKIS